MDLVPAVWVPLKISCILDLRPLPSSMHCFGVKVICFWHLNLGKGHFSYTFKKLPPLFKSYHDRFDMGEKWLGLHFAFFKFLTFSWFSFFILLLSENWWFVLYTNTAIILYNSKEFLSFRVVFHIRFNLPFGWSYVHPNSMIVFDLNPFFTKFLEVMRGTHFIIS